MKKNNESITHVFKILNLFIISLVILNLCLLTKILIYNDYLFPAYYLSIFVIFLIYITSGTGSHFYEIDTKGETITFEAERLDLLSIFRSNKKKIDLPKYKLVKYNYKRGIFSKEIVFFIKSKRSQNFTKIKYRLAFVSDKNIKNILVELDKIIENNNLQEKIERDN